MSDDYDLSDGIVSVREFSNAATKILRAAETQNVTVLIGRRGKVFAALLPTTARQLMESWEDRNDTAFAAASDSRPSREAFEKLKGAVFQTPSGDHDVDFSNGSVTIRDLTRATSKVLKAVGSGRPLLVTRHSKVVAMLVPRDSAMTFGQLLEAADPTMAAASIPEAWGKGTGTTTVPEQSRSWLERPDQLGP